MHNIKKIYAKFMAKGGELDSFTRELQIIKKVEFLDNFCSRISQIDLLFPQFSWKSPKNLKNRLTAWGVVY